MQYRPRHSPARGWVTLQEARSQLTPQQQLEAHQQAAFHPHDYLEMLERKALEYAKAQQSYIKQLEAILAREDYGPLPKVRDEENAVFTRIFGYTSGVCPPLSHHRRSNSS